MEESTAITDRIVEEALEQLWKLGWDDHNFRIVVKAAIWKARDEGWGDGVRTGLKETLCPVCGKHFIAKTHNQRFCSYQCRWYNQSQKHRTPKE